MKTKPQHSFNLVKSASRSGYYADEHAENQREKRFLEAVLASTTGLLRIVKKDRPVKLSTGTVIQRLTLEVVKEEPPRCEACDKQKPLNKNGHCKSCARMSEK